MPERELQGESFVRLSTFLVPVLADLKTAIESGVLTSSPKPGLTLLESLEIVETAVKKGETTRGLMEPLYDIRDSLLKTTGFETHLLKFELFIFFTSTGQVSLKELLDSLSDEDLDELIHQTEVCLKSETTYQIVLKRALISTVFLSNSKNFMAQIVHYGFTGDIRKEKFDQPFFHFLFKLLARYPLTFPFQISLLASYISDASLKNEVEQMLGVAKDEYQGSFVESHANWDLCEHAELRMIRSLRENGILLLTDSLGEGLILLKFYGKLTGLVLKSFTTKSGQIITQGLWVSPVSTKLRADLKQTFDRSKARVPLTSFNGDWVFMRGVDDENFKRDREPTTSEGNNFEGVLLEARKIKNNPPNILKRAYQAVTKKMPKNYRQLNDENPE